MKRRSLLPLLAAAALAACSPPAADTATDAAAALPDWTGIWVAEDTEIDISGYPRVGEGMNLDLLANTAPWTEAQRAKMAVELPRIMAADATRRGQGWGYPLMMEGVAPLQFLVTPRETLILNFYRDIRHVFTDGRALPAAEDRWPVPWGESVGHWEGDTLVIETVSVRNGSVLPLPLPPLTPEAHFSERLRKTGPDRMELTMTIEDPAVLEKPWVITFGYKRAEGLDRLVHDVIDNDRSAVEDGSLTIAPPGE